MLKYHVALPSGRRPSPRIEGLEVVSSLRSAYLQNQLDGKLAAMITLNRFLLGTEFRRYAVYRDNLLAHYQTVLGKNPRFPFMGRRDVCVSYAHTTGIFQGQGLYTAVLRRVMADYSDRVIWVFASEKNLPSLRVIEKVGFEFVGLGHRTRVLGTRLFGRFEISEWASTTLRSRVDACSSK